MAARIDFEKAFENMLSKYILLVASVASVSTLCKGLSPKMVTIQADTESLLDAMDDSMNISSSTYYAVGESCSGFTFDLSGGSGYGVIAVASQGNELSFSFSNENEQGSIDLNENINNVGNIFNVDAGQDQGDLLGHAFSFAGISANGAQVQVSCSVDTHIFVLYSDASKSLEVEASVSSDIELVNGDSEYELEADVVQDISGRRILSQRRVLKGNKHSIHVGNDDKLKLIQVVRKNKEGVALRRTLVAPTRKPLKKLKIKLEETTIEDNGDVVFTLSGLGTETTKVTGRVCLVIHSEVIAGSCVDVSAMLTSEKPNLVVHPGWIRKAIQETNNSAEWDVELVEVVASDPENMYRKVGQMKRSEPKTAGRLLRSAESARKLLSGPPSKEEMEITMEMRVGRKPIKEKPNMPGRSLSGNHKKILVHGYCSSTGNPFTNSHFTNYAVFSDPAVRRRLGGTSGTNNWSNDLFARKIDQFADDLGLHGCGIIAHSQGGLAALHLYTYYWSCLDYGEYGGTRMIQSVGSPYQGTTLAGNIAAIGDVFGTGCGTQNDLTHAGAASWLSSIPSWARSKVHYYTTSFKDRWWAYDYCHLVSDVVLNDPDDGVIEKARGQLSGATNRGHTDNQCHTKYMRDPSQTENQSRNSNMNVNARY